MAKKVTKIVIPAAGFGTRFLPVTKASPKEMLPIVDKPVIQYIVEEAVASGIEEVVLITGSTKRPIEDHFDYNFELEELLKRSGKTEQYEEIRAISDMARFVYIRQREQLGNGHAVLQAKSVIGDSPFVVVWGDELFQANPPRIKQLIDAYNQHQTNIIMTYQSTDPKVTDLYAIAVGEKVDDRLIKLKSVIEKPGSSAIPPYAVSVGGYVFNPEVFDALESITPGKNGEIWLVDAINQLAQNGSVLAYDVQNGRHYDCGNKLEYIKANIEFALQRPDIGEDLRKYLGKL
ncbi:MAG: UTP--glucose-1-phosphate uridylyltransferase [Patescibacteria group bacterium]|jgi:UTP--glucose-1-phosphate uridylyltransferase